MNISLRRSLAAVTAAMCVAAVPVAAHAQTASHYSLYLIRGADTVMVERVSRSAGALVGQFRLGGAAVVSYVAVLDDSARITQLDMAAAPKAARPTFARLRFAGDTLAVTTTSDSMKLGAQGVTARLVAAHDAILQINPSVAFMGQIVRRARALSPTPSASPVTVPLLFAQGGAQVAASVVWAGSDSALLTVAATQIRLAMAPDGSVLGGAIPSQGLAIVRGPARQAFTSGPPPTPPDYSAPAGAPYTAEDVVVGTPDGSHLAGTLTLPRRTSTARRLPAVVMITGSGPEDRNSESAAIPGWKPFAQIADTLGRRGIAVLRLDDRGVGGSDPGPDSPTGFASDIRAAVAYLRSRPEIDPRRIGLVGHSEGGLVAPMVAATDSSIEAVVLMAAPAQPVRVLADFQQRYVVDSLAHLTGTQRAAALAQDSEATNALMASSPEIRELMERDPAPLLRSLHQPVLVLQGERDYQVPAAQAAKVAALIRANGNREVTVRIFPGLNHLFVRDEHKGYDYAGLSSLVVPRDVLGALADWLTARLK
jgi:pimeloyl-ACP methyl ester carboxylesterase